MRGPARTIAAAASALVLGTCWPGCSSGSPGGAGTGRRPVAGARDRPASVLVVLVDALRPDHLGCYGYARPTSPILDRLAAGAVLFENVSAASSWTKPSVPSLFTSKYPSQHGVFEGDAHDAGRAPESDVLPDEAVTLAEALERCGYATTALVHNAQLRGRFGLAQGFDRYEEASLDAPAMIRRLLSWIREDGTSGGGPFFSYLHLLDTHWPYEPAPEAARLFGIEVPSGGARRDDPGLREAVNEGLVSLSAEEIQGLVARYDAEIRTVDAALGDLLAGLREQGILEEMLLIVTSDHGEAFLEHGRLGHGGDLYEESIRVPLIVRMPGGLRAGLRVAERVSALDVMPTILDVAGCPGAAPASLEGRSLRRFLEGDASAAGQDAGGRAIVAEVRHGRTSSQALWKDGWKLIRTIHRPPAPLRPPAAGDPLEAHLVGMRLEVEGRRLEGDRFVASEIEAESADDDDDEVSGVLEMLDPDRVAARLLGYTVEMGDAVVEAPGRRKVEAAALASGAAVKIEGRAAGPDRFVAEKVRLQEGEPEVEIEGIVRRVLPSARAGMLELEIAGLRVVARRSRIERALGAAAAPAAGDGATSGTAASPRITLELYELRDDPGERRNLASTNPARSSALLAELEAWERRMAMTSLGRAGRALLDEETVRELKALGYVQ